MSSSRMTYKASGTNTKKDVKFASDCVFYIGEEEASVSEMEEMVESGTTYVKLTVNKNGDAIKVIFSEDTFDENTQNSAAKKTYEVVGFTDSRIIVESGGTKTTYTFGSTNPTNNITFYTWDAGKEEWDSTTLKKAEDFYDDADDEVYCRFEFNSGGRKGYGGFFD